MEPFKRYPQLGRFTLRDEGRTVAVGKVLKIIEWDFFVFIVSSYLF